MPASSMKMRKRPRADVEEEHRGRGKEASLAGVLGRARPPSSLPPTLIAFKTLQREKLAERGLCDKEREGEKEAKIELRTYERVMKRKKMAGNEEENKLHEGEGKGRNDGKGMENGEIVGGGGFQGGDLKRLKGNARARSFGKSKHVSKMDVCDVVEGEGNASGVRKAEGKGDRGDGKEPACGEAKAVKKLKKTSAGKCKKPQGLKCLKRELKEHQDVLHNLLGQRVEDNLKVNSASGESELAGGLKLRLMRSPDGFKLKKARGNGNMGVIKQRNDFKVSRKSKKGKCDLRNAAMENVGMMDEQLSTLDETQRISPTSCAASDSYGTFAAKAWAAMDIGCEPIEEEATSGERQEKGEKGKKGDGERYNERKGSTGDGPDIRAEAIAGGDLDMSDLEPGVQALFELAMGPRLFCHSETERRPLSDVLHPHSIGAVCIGDPRADERKDCARQLAHGQLKIKDYQKENYDNAISRSSYHYQGMKDATEERVSGHEVSMTVSQQQAVAELHSRNGHGRTSSCAGMAPSCGMILALAAPPASMASANARGTTSVGGEDYSLAVNNVRLSQAGSEQLMAERSVEGKEVDFPLGRLGIEWVSPSVWPEEKEQISFRADVEGGSAQLGGVVSFPQGTVLEGGSTLLWPLWLHAREAGSVRFNMVLYYEPEGEAGSMKYRTLRTTHALQVESSLQVGMHISPSPSSLGRYIMRVDVTNRHAADSFWLRQVSCADPAWEMAPLSSPVLTGGGGGEAAFISASITPPQLLPPGQASSLFFQLQASSGAVSDDMAKDSSAAKWGRNLLLGAPEGSAAALIDLSTGPLHHFHLLERQLQALELGALEQGQQLLSTRGSTAETLPGGPDNAGVDVVLMWESPSNGAPSDAEAAAVLSSSTHIGSHHICHSRVAGWSPVQWAMQGPACIRHDFLQQPVCELPLSLSLRNSSTLAAAIHVDTIDSAQAALGTSADPEQGGWFQPSAGTAGAEGSAAVSAAVQGGGEMGEEPCGAAPSGPFLWSGSTCRALCCLPPGGRAQVPLTAAVLSPGMFDFSSLRVSWTLTTPSSDVIGEREGRPAADRPRGQFKAAGASPSSREEIQLQLCKTGPNSWRWIFPRIPREGSGMGHPFLCLVLPSGEE